MFASDNVVFTVFVTQSRTTHADNVHHVSRLVRKINVSVRGRTDARGAAVVSPPRIERFESIRTVESSRARGRRRRRCRGGRPTEAANRPNGFRRTVSSLYDRIIIIANRRPSFRRPAVRNSFRFLYCFKHTRIARRRKMSLYRVTTISIFVFPSRKR